jgi:RimJ/RimL family protein N-acetyltransferase
VTGSDLHIPLIETERLTLRAPQRADFECYADLMGSDRAAHICGPYDRPAAWAIFAGNAASWILDGFGGWSITDRATGAYLGEVAISKPARYPETELGWSLIAKAEGKGIAFEAVSATRDYAFRNLGFATLVSYIMPGNARSIRLAERLGASRDEDADYPGDDLCLVYRHLDPEGSA